MLPHVPLKVAAQSSGNTLAEYLTAMETPFAAPLNIYIQRVIRSGNISLLMYDVNNAQLLAGLNPENPLPVASAFKAALPMWFVDTVDRDVWNSVPVEHWNAPAASEVPEAYRDHWRRHGVILRDLYRTLVFSDNHATGVILGYLAEQSGSTDAVIAFNDWAAQRVGMSQISGLSGWSTGVPADMTHTDERFKERGTNIAGQLYTFENMMTARDIGLFYMWMLTELDAEQQAVVKALLSTIHNNRGANLERLALENNGVPYSKNGSLETDGGYVVTDAGLMQFEDGRHYLLVMLSLGAPDKIQPLFEELNATLRGKHNEVFHNKYVDYISAEELLESYRQQLSVAYPLQTDNSGSLLKYGFILPSGVKVYSQPDEDAELHNPIIKSTLFGVHLLMQGALVRYKKARRGWVELITDNDFDNVRSRLGWQVFVKAEDVWRISLDYAQPIPYLIDDSTQPGEKYVVIDLSNRELYAFEGETPVLRVPIVLNPDFTPRGAQVITSKWLARSMQPWAPGVPFTSFFGSDGYALHGSPWQRWSTTVNTTTITGRSSAGCVNVPDWMVQAGDYTRPADELLWRWVGGMANPVDDVFEYPTDDFPALRIYNVDYLRHVRGYVRPEGMIGRGLVWDDVLAMMETMPLQAPESFFV
ncbi:MAG: L,D-transpeptidase [Chloroflexota bacterium]